MVDHAPTYSYCLSQDLGKIGDYHASILTETIFQVRSRTVFKRQLYKPGDTEVIYPEIHIRGISRSQMGYDKLVDWTREKLQDYRLVNNCWHVIDLTGVGQPVLDFMRRVKLTPVGIYTTSGNIAREQDYGYTVPKAEIITNFQTVLSRGLLNIPEKLDKAIKDQLIHEITHYKETINKRTHNVTYDAMREKDHDDLVTSLMLNCWWVCKQNGIVTEVRRHESLPDDYNPLKWEL